MSTDTPSVAIVGDQPLSRAGLEKIVAEEPTLRVVASAPSVDRLANVDCEVVVVELTPRASVGPLETITAAARIGWALVCSPWEGAPTLVSAVRAGARGLITPHTEPDVIREALRTVTHGGFYLCPTLVRRFQAELARPRQGDPSGLAPREVETLRFIAMGYTHSQIATRMGLSQVTVNTYVKRIRAKLNAGNAAELTRLAIELGHVSAKGYRAAPAA